MLPTLCIKCSSLAVFRWFQLFNPIFSWGRMAFFFSYMSRPSVHMKPVNLLTKNRVYLKPLSREVKGPSTLIRVTKWLCGFKNARIHVDGALNWSYFLNNYIIGSCLFFVWIYSTGSSNADDYNLATDNHCNYFDFCPRRRVVIGKFLRYFSGP